jgi:hypothetical protein
MAGKAKAKPSHGKARRPLVDADGKMDHVDTAFTPVHDALDELLLLWMVDPSAIAVSLPAMPSDFWSLHASS